MSYSNEPPSRRILVVDDLADNCHLLQVLLEFEGYEVETADNGYSAIAKVENQPPDLMLLDVMMPDLDGYEVAQWVGQNQPDVPIMFVTACSDPSLVSTVAAKVAGCIRKPFDIDTVITQVNRLVQNPSAVTA